MPFTTRTAQNYLKVIRNKDKVEKENVSLILDADSILKLRGGQCNETENEKEVLEIAIDLAKKLYENESCVQKQFDGFVRNGVS